MSLSQNKYRKRKVIATLISSPIASFIAKFVTYPIDTLKNKVQVNTLQVRKLSHYKVGHSIVLAKNIYETQGVRGFFPGVTITTFGSIIAFAVYLTIYEQLKVVGQKHEFLKHYPTANYLLSSFIAQAIACGLWLPIDIIKGRLQVQSVVKIYKYDGPRDAIKKIHKTEGVRGLYRAYGATLTTLGPTIAIFFATYQKMKSLFVDDPKNQKVIETILCSSVAGAISNFITTPLQMIKMRLQIQRACGSMKTIQVNQTLYGYQNIFHGLYVCWKKQGFMSLYKGAGLRVAFAIPLHTITCTLAQKLRLAAMNSSLPDYIM